MLKIYENLIQGSEEWLEARRGLLTASEIHKIMTPTGKIANNKDTRAHVYELLAQRISEYVEPAYISDDMLRGQEQESYARNTYADNYAEVTNVGFITNDKWGFTIGYSPDGLVGDDGLIEIKCRRQKFQVETIVLGVVPDEFMLQIQCGLLVSERKWCDFISYHGGLPMFVKRVEPLEVMQAAIVEAATKFEEQVAAALDAYKSAEPSMVKTERIIEQEIF